MSQDVQWPRHPDLASAFADGGARAIFYANPADGTEVVVAGGEVLAARGKGPVKRGPARVLDEHGGNFGRVAQALLGDPSEPVTSPKDGVGTALIDRERARVRGMGASEDEARENAEMLGEIPEWTDPEARGMEYVRATSGALRAWKRSVKMPAHIAGAKGGKGSLAWQNGRFVLSGTDQAPKRPRAKLQSHGAAFAHPRGGRTTVVDILLPKDRFPTPADAAAWLLARKRPYRADQIEDNGTVNAGNFWRCHQVDAPAGKPLRTIVFPPAKGREDESRIQALIVVDRPGKGTAKRTAKPSEGRTNRANPKLKATAAATKAATKTATKRSTAGPSAARSDAPIVVIACSKSKAGTRKPVAAKDLYASGLFKDSYAYAEALTKKGGAIRILSGTHGWLKPTAKIAPQDQTLDRMSAPERRAWGKRVLAQMVKEFGAGRRRFVCLAGEKYTDAIKAANPPAAWLCEEPLRGEGLGKRWHHVRRLLAKATKADRAG